MEHVHGLPDIQRRQITLVATDEGKGLYEALGYQIVAHLNKMVAQAPTSQTASLRMPINVRPMVEKDLPSIIRLDATAIGGAREDLIRARFNQACAKVVAVGDDTQPTGFALGADQKGQLLCGPVVATDDVTAYELIQSLPGQYHGSIRVDVHDGKSGLLKLLSSTGFQRETHPPQMIRHGGRPPMQGPTFYAPMAQMFG